MTHEQPNTARRRVRAQEQRRAMPPIWLATTVLACLVLSVLIAQSLAFYTPVIPPEYSRGY